ncbi:MAG: hypothetical protein EB150_10375 [Nitrososphaeria archaeon]|nr:hypothetical protein [Nitrososphaeria archaeon]NDB63909.1 hypothetical protein [Nitrosopumilaceae archaeon]NDF30580.1 hypothetical protein [Nitrososphaeria archaeon]
MGRKPKNEFVEASLAFKENSKIKKYDVKMPFLYAVTIQIDDPNSTKVTTTRECFVRPDSNLSELIKELENQKSPKIKVIKTEPAIRQFIDLCPKCHNRGVPKIEKKNTQDNRERSWRNKEKSETRKERTPEYWFVYTHTKSKKCRICQYINTPDPTFKRNKISIEKYFFPHVLASLKQGSLRYDDQVQ